ncbi:unnamed protein product, partial [Prorocentrum cordatum]
ASNALERRVCLWGPVNTSLLRLRPNTLYSETVTRGWTPHGGALFIIFCSPLSVSILAQAVSAQAALAQGLLFPVPELGEGPPEVNSSDALLPTAGACRQGGGPRMEHHGRLLTTRNTFLHCPAPWTDSVELPARHSSDPGASADTSTAPADVDAAPREPPAGALRGRWHAASARRVRSSAPDLAAAGGSPAAAAARARLPAGQARGPGPAGPSGAAGAGAAGAGPAERQEAAGEAAGEAFVRISKTRRRREQRREARIIKAQVSGATGAGSSSAPLAAGSRRASRCGGEGSDSAFQ